VLNNRKSRREPPSWCPVLPWCPETLECATLAIQNLDPLPAAR
jgi:hypothetical protein